MTRIASTAAIIAAMIFASCDAQAFQKTYVSSNGSDTSSGTVNCFSFAPCATFQKAYDLTDAGGEIVCLSSGAFGAINIHKSITVDCLGVVAVPAVSNSDAHVEITTSSSDRVVLRGLDIQAAAGNVYGILFQAAGTLILDRVKVSSNSVNGAPALAFLPIGVSKLVVTDSTFANGGGSSSGAGIRIVPDPGGSAQVALTRVTVAGNAFGIALDGNFSTAGINASIIDSVIAGNAQDGIIATSQPGKAPIGVYVKNSQSLNNAIGIRSIGSNVTVRVDGSSIIGNGTGVTSSSGGSLLTFGNNAVRANGNDGAFSGSVALQ